ncbi:MAG: signal peptide peptidase SppA [Spirochaetaceae bacterium]|nr:signal peptide peptidase SppA [Spirochaetaceae bacterium]
MSDITPNEEGKKNEEAVIPSSSEESVQIVPSETPVQAEEAEAIEEPEKPIQFEPIFKAQPLEVVAQSSSYSSTTEEAKPAAKSKLKKSRGFWVFCFLIGAVVIASVVGIFLPNKDLSDVFNDSSFSTSISSFPTKNKGKANKLPKYNHDYIARIDIKGVIQEKNETYNQKWLLDMIGSLMKDENNKGLFIYVDSPGGSVYEADELYLKLCEYKETTGRPIYAYFSHMAASGGYYIGCVADYIMANRNCTTGSIGVIMGPVYTLTGLFEKYGIESTSITAGKNKNMFNINEPITAEQRQIIQDYINEAYDQFTGIVAKERSLPIERVREIADGRIYTAKQALEIKLIDKICGYDEAVDYMKSELYNDSGIALEYVEYVYEKTFSDFFSSISTKISGQKADSFLDYITERINSCPKGPAYFYGGAF